MNYREYKDKEQERVNAFTKKAMVFAFSEEQLNEQLKERGWTKDDLVHLHLGLCHKDYYKEGLDLFLFENTNRRLWKEIKKDKTGDGFIYQMFSYELSNHEYIVTGDVFDTLGALGLSLDDVNSYQPLVRGLKKAMDEYEGRF